MAAPAHELTAVVQRLRRAPRALRVAMIAIFAFSALIRVTLACASTPAFVSDAADYRQLARNLLDGLGYVQHYEGETESFQGFTFRAFRPPGYPLFLAALHAVVGWNDYAYLLVNLVADLVTQFCYLLSATAVLGVGPAVLVQALLAMHVLWMPNPMTESLHTALLAGLALLLVLGTVTRRIKPALLFGLLGAAALLVRPVTLVVFPALAWRSLRRPFALRAGLCLGVAVAPSVAVICVWSVRNYRLFGMFVPFTTNIGFHNAWDYGFHPEVEFSRLRAAGLNEAQINRELVRMEWDRARHYPGHWLVTCAERGADLFSLTPAYEVEKVLWKLILNPESSLVARLYRASYRQYAVTYLLAAGGAIALALRRRALGGLWSLLVFYVLIHAVWSRGDIRLLAPIYPVLCVLGGGLAAAVRDGLSLSRRPAPHAGRPAAPTSSRRPSQA